MLTNILKLCTRKNASLAVHIESNSFIIMLYLKVQTAKCGGLKSNNILILTENVCLLILRSNDFRDELLSSLKSTEILPLTNGNRMSWSCQPLTHLLICPDTLRSHCPKNYFLFLSNELGKGCLAAFAATWWDMELTELTVIHFSFFNDRYCFRAHSSRITSYTCSFGYTIGQTDDSGFRI